MSILRLFGRFSRFCGIVSHLLVANLISRHNLRAAWRQSDRGWSHALGVWDVPDDELEAWVQAMEDA